MGLRSVLIRHDAIGLHYAVRICIGTTAVWLLLRSLGDADADAIWAVISVIVATEPQMQTAVFAFMSRIVNTVIGCTIGLTFLLVAGPEVWVLPLALTVTVLVCTYLVRLSSSWRLAPATAAIIIASGVVEQSRITWSGGRPPSCGGSRVGLRRGLPGNLVHVEHLGAASGSRGRRTLIKMEVVMTQTFKPNNPRPTCRETHRHKCLTTGWLKRPTSFH